MKKLIVILTVLALFLTSCATVVKTKEVIGENKVDEKEEVIEAPVESPEEKDETPVESGDDVTPPEESLNPEEPVETPTDPDALPTPDENELDAKEIDFTDITEEDLEDLLSTITGGQTIEFPIIPIE